MENIPGIFVVNSDEAATKKVEKVGPNFKERDYYGWVHPHEQIQQISEIKGTATDKRQKDELLEEIKMKKQSLAPNDRNLKQQCYQSNPEQYQVSETIKQEEQKLQPKKQKVEKPNSEDSLISLQNQIKTKKFNTKLKPIIIIKNSGSYSEKDRTQQEQKKQDQPLVKKKPNSIDSQISKQVKPKTKIIEPNSEKYRILDIIPEQKQQDQSLNERIIVSDENVGDIFTQLIHFEQRCSEVQNEQKNTMYINETKYPQYPTTFEYFLQIGRRLANMNLFPTYKYLIHHLSLKKQKNHRELIEFHNILLYFARNTSKILLIFQSRSLFKSIIKQFSTSPFNCFNNDQLEQRMQRFIQVIQGGKINHFWFEKDIFNIAKIKRMLQQELFLKIDQCQGINTQNQKVKNGKYLHHEPIEEVQETEEKGSQIKK